ncbi:hypothetical protein MKX01_036506 [Papaver californicum]|nr:hypothetical protein MKX01_036506 [Papaver californicum]
MRALKLLSSASSLSHQSIRFNGITRTSSSPITFSSLQQRQQRNRVDLLGIRSRPPFLLEMMSEFEYELPADDCEVMEKEAALHLAVAQLSSEFGTGSMLSLRRFFGSRHAQVISTGSLKIVEIFGQKASGKTTLALHVIKEAQKLGGYYAYVDVENALDPSLAESIGVNTEDLLVSHVESVESSLSVVDTLIKSGSIDVIVVDSAALVLNVLMTQALRKIHSSLDRSQIVLIFINQVRYKPSDCFGPATQVTCGGSAMKFYPSITGVSICVQVVKNKLAPAMKKADEAEVLEMACTHGVISKMIDGYYIEGKLLKDKQEAEKYVAENHEVLDKLVRALRR